MPLCIELTTTGTRCTREALQGHRRCRQHGEIHREKVQQAGPEVVGRCNHFVKRVVDLPARGRAQIWQRCGANPVAGHAECRRHHNLEQRAQERIQAREARDAAHQAQMQQIQAAAEVTATQYWQTYRELLDATVPVNDIIEAIAVENREGRINGLATNMLMNRIEIRTGIQSHVLWMRYHQFRFPDHHAIQQIVLPEIPAVAAAPVPRPDRRLQDIVRDGQNVHTREVSEQSNRGLKILLEQKVPKEENALREVVASWFLTRNDIPYMDILDLEKDVRKWYCTKTCRTHKDWLYRKTFQGLWFIIKSHEHKTELEKRLFEECKESNGLCCDGHINRLINVMVGFDDRFAPPVPIKEVLQNKMAAIANLDIDDDEKIMRAKAVLMDLKIPEAEHQDWLAAF